MKTWKKVVLGIVLTLVIAISAIVIWQWENISALYIFITSSGEEITQMAQESHQTKEEVLSKYDGITVSDLTPEQENAIISGEMTVEEAVETIEKSDKKEQTAKPQTAQKPTVSKETEIVNRYLKQIYALKAEFLGKLSNIKDEAQAEFYKHPMEERTQANKTKAITDKVIECYELENQCDIKIDKLLKSLKSELQAIGADTSIVEEIRKAYKDEKSVKKAYYIKLASESD